MDIKRIVMHDMLNSNCYIISAGGENALIDSGYYSAELDAALKAADYKLKYILLTHVHFDHICGADEVKNKTGAALCIHELDADGLNGKSPLNLHDIGGVTTPSLQADILLHDSDALDLGGVKITVMHTPGHSPGSVCYIAKSNIFTGDTLFAGTVGRTDFPSGNFALLSSSLRRLSLLGGDFTVYPGHGQATTLEHERKNNVYMVNIR